MEGLNFEAAKYRITELIGLSLIHICLTDKDVQGLFLHESLTVFLSVTAETFVKTDVYKRQGW